MFKTILKIYFLTSFFLINHVYSQTGRFRVQGTKVQIAYNSNSYVGETITFGKELLPLLMENGDWSIGMGV